MDKVIFKYLNEVYYIETVVCFGKKIKQITKKDSNDMLGGLGLCEIRHELNKIFSLSGKEIKWHIKAWARIQDKEFDIDKFWSCRITFKDYPLYKSIEKLIRYHNGFRLEYAPKKEMNPDFILYSHEETYSPIP